VLVVLDIEDDFKLQVQEFVSSLLSPDSLVIKEINGTKITGKELIEYFRVRVVHFYVAPFSVGGLH